MSECECLNSPDEGVRFTIDLPLQHVPVWLLDLSQAVLMEDLVRGEVSIMRDVCPTKTPI